MQRRWKTTHPVEHICPALEGDTLEDGEHGLSEVVEAGDAPLGSLPLPTALRSIRAVEDASTWRWILHHVTWAECDATPMESESVMRAEYLWILLPKGINAWFNVPFQELFYHFM